MTGTGRHDGHLAESTTKSIGLQVEHEGAELLSIEAAEQRPTHNTAGGS